MGNGNQKYLYQLKSYLRSWNKTELNTNIVYFYIQFNSIYIYDKGITCPIISNIQTNSEYIYPKVDHHTKGNWLITNHQSIKNCRIS